MDGSITVIASTKDTEASMPATSFHALNENSSKPGSSHGPYAGLRDLVLVHVGDTRRAQELATFGDGIVLRGKAGFGTARTIPDLVPMLIDTERYVPGRKVADGQGRILPEPPEESIEAQISAGVTCLLAPSTFPTERDPASIRAALDAGHSYVEAARRVAPGVPAFVPIVVRFNELVDRRWVRPVAESGLPVATVFAGYGNPLSERGAIPGAVDLVDAAAAIMPLRCDTSVAGLLALGAVAGAIGSSSSVRHLYLPRRGRRNHAASRSMFVPAFANWLKVRFVKRAWADPDLDDLFVCECSVCGTRGDVRALTEPGVSNQMQDNHSIASAVKLIRSVVDADRRVIAWRDVCERALTAYQKLARYGFGDEGPTDRGVSQAWLDVVG